jgi:hypothetical protein
MKILSLALIFPFLLVNDSQTHNDRPVVQFDIGKILNARPVTILFKGKLIPWVKGIDGDGLADGCLTRSAALFNGDKDPHALPDDPIFAANSSHPEIKLHYSNNESVNKQACGISGDEVVEFRLPHAKYKDIYLALTSAEGSSTLHVKLNYADGVHLKDMTVPDWYWDVKPNDPDVCYLVSDLAKWGNKNNMTEKNHHNIDLVNIHPDQTRVLESIGISKNKPTYMVLWAATGVKAD